MRHFRQDVITRPIDDAVEALEFITRETFREHFDQRHTGHDRGGKLGCGKGSAPYGDFESAKWIVAS